MKFIWRGIADLIFAVHALLFILVLSGWAFPKLWVLYAAFLGVTIVSNITLGYCFLSRWEFMVRKRYDPTLEYNSSWAGYYARKLFGPQGISENFWKYAFLTYLICVLGIVVWTNV